MSGPAPARPACRWLRRPAGSSRSTRQPPQPCHGHRRDPLIAAHITSWLDCSGATLTNEGVRALTGDRLTVDGDLFLTRARRAAHLGRPVPIPIELGAAPLE